MGDLIAYEAKFPATGMPDADWWAALWPDPEEVLRKLGLDHDLCVLDLCCGDGHFTLAMAQIVNAPGRVMALDLDAEMLAQAQERAEADGLPEDEILWLCQDACALVDNLPAAPDIVFMANTFHGVPDAGALAAEVFAVLKPGGQFIIINWHHWPREETTVLDQPRGPATDKRLSPDQTCEKVLGAGFALHGVIELPPYHYGIVFDKPA